MKHKTYHVELVLTQNKSVGTAYIRREDNQDIFNLFNGPAKDATEYAEELSKFMDVGIVTRYQ